MKAMMIATLMLAAQTAVAAEVDLTCIRELKVVNAIYETRSMGMPGDVLMDNLRHAEVPNGEAYRQYAISVATALYADPDMEYDEALVTSYRMCKALPTPPLTR